MADLELYVNSQFASVLRKEAGIFVFHAEMAARAGIEPAPAMVQATKIAATCESDDEGRAQRDAQKFGELSKVMGNWAKLPPEIRFAVLALVRAGQRARS